MANQQIKSVVFAGALTLYALGFGNQLLAAKHVGGFDRTHYLSESSHVQKQVRFWEKIFASYPSTTVLIHDANFPELVTDLIDFKVFAKSLGGKVLTDRSYRNRISDGYLSRYQMALKRFHTKGRKAVLTGAIERRIFNVYKTKPAALKLLLKGQVSIRSQTGLADEFKRAVERSYKFLPFMERVFQRENLPIDLTRIAFVESMFNPKAVSKVGASGIWQFMPATARQFMKVDKFIDERNSPYKASEGAAKLLAKNYRHLRSWPLAVTAYNFGRAGMAKAKRRMGTDDLGYIIKNYRAKSFGFASKNFYAEFIAARNIYRSYFSDKPKRFYRNDVMKVKLKKPITIARLVSKTSINKDLLSRYNLCLTPRALKHYHYSPLPAGFNIYVPAAYASSVKLAVGRSSKARQERF